MSAHVLTATNPEERAMLRSRRSLSETRAAGSSRTANSSVYLASSSAVPRPTDSNGNARGARRALPRQWTKKAVAAELQVLRAPN
jgi:hypothetical protein